LKQLHPEIKVEAIVVSRNIPDIDKTKAYAAAQLSINMCIRETIVFLARDSLFDNFTSDPISLG
jgi:hypothetical protein